MLPAGRHEWLSVEDLADELQITVSTIYSWRSKGTAPKAHRIGKYLRFRRSDIDVWLSDRVDADT